MNRSRISQEPEITMSFALKKVSIAILSGIGIGIGYYLVKRVGMK